MVSFIKRKVDLLLLLWLLEAPSPTPSLEFCYVIHWKGSQVWCYVEIVLIMLVALIFVGFVVLFLPILGSLVSSCGSLFVRIHL